MAAVSGRDDGGPASATPVFEDGEIVGVTVGLSVRDVFAAHAMPVLMGKHPADRMTPERIAAAAYAQADAMLAARKQP